MPPELAAGLAEVQRLLSADRLAARSLAGDLVAAHPDSAQARLMLAAAHSLLQDYPGAVGHLEACWQMAPDPLIAFNLGYCLRQVGDYQQGLTRLLMGLALPGASVDHLALAANTAAVAGERAFAARLVSGRPEPVPALQRWALGEPDATGVLAGRAARDTATLFWMKYDCHLYQQIDDKAEFARMLAPDPDAGPWYLPTSYALPAQAAAAQRRLSRDDGSRWLLKHANESGGRAMQVLTAPTRAPLAGTAAQVVQRLVDPPFLYHGRKLNLRLMLALPRPEPSAARLWASGLAYFAAAPYEVETGTAGPGLVANLLRVDSGALAGALGDLPAHVVDLDAFLEILPAGARQTLRAALTGLVRQLVADLEARGFLPAVRALGSGFLPRFVGLDVGLDADLRPWLFEIERYPGLGGVSPMTARINGRFRADWMRLVLDDPEDQARRFIPVG